MKYIVGIDQGGTKTCVCISDFEGNIIGSKITNGCWQNVEGMDKALKYMLEGYYYLIKKNEITEQEIEMIVAGVAGIDFKFEEELIYEEIKKYFKNKRVIIVNDSIIALRSGLSKLNGAIVCAGTGSNCVVSNADGKIKIFGHYIDDDLQGASGIGKRAVKAVFDSEAGVAKKTMLTEKILKHYVIDNVDHLLEEYVNKNYIKADLKNLTPYVFDCAEQGDEISKEILETFGKQLARFVVSGAKKLDIAKKPFDLVITGGVFTKKDNLITKGLMREVKDEIPKTNLIEPVYEPVLGAIFLGFDRLGIEINEKIKKNIFITSKENDLLRKRG